MENNMFCDKFRVHPLSGNDCEAIPLGYTMVTCSHPYHGVEVFYFGIEQWSDSFMAVTRPYWANNYTIVCTPME